LFFSAVNPLMRTGVQQQLQTDDLLHLSAAAHPTSSTDDLWEAWQEVRIIPTAMSNQENPAQRNATGAAASCKSCSTWATA
jgi:hypothetical protein